MTTLDRLFADAKLEGCLRRAQTIYLAKHKDSSVGFGKPGERSLDEGSTFPLDHSVERTSLGPCNGEFKA